MSWDNPGWAEAAREYCDARGPVLWRDAPPPDDDEGSKVDIPPLKAAGLGEWDAGDDTELPPPRGWLLGNIFCRGFMSSLLADGAVGKTALRYAQLLSLATGKSLTGDHVFQRSRVLIISLEDDANELRRRILAVRKHYNIDLSELSGWLFLAAPGAAGGKLMTADRAGRLSRGALAANIEAVITKRNIDCVSLDPFVKAHSVDENSNSAIDDVVQVLTDMSAKHNIAVDAPHHTSKGVAEPGNASRGRGASAMNNGGRLVYTLTHMNPDEAQAFGIPETERKQYVRMDSAKVNITKYGAAKWFCLVSVTLGNGTNIYPNGDDVQTVETWKPPDTWEGLDSPLLNRILDDIDTGLPNGIRYTDYKSATARAAWKVITKQAPTKTEMQAREVIKTWIKTGLLEVVEYENPGSRKQEKGLRVNAAKRPS